MLILTCFPVIDRIKAVLHITCEFDIAGRNNIIVTIKQLGMHPAIRSRCRILNIARGKTPCHIALLTIPMNIIHSESMWPNR